MNPPFAFFFSTLASLDLAPDRFIGVALATLTCNGSLLLADGIRSGATAEKADNGKLLALTLRATAADA